LGFPVKVLLIYPYFVEERIRAEDIRPVPIGLYSVAAVLKDEGYDVEVLNWHEIHKTPEKIKETLIRKKPDVIGFSVLHGNRWGGIELARVAKEINPDVTVVFGGIGATFLWEHFLKHFPEIDFAILGEGEYSFLHLLRALEKPGAPDFKRIQGIAFRKQGELISTGRAGPIQNLDELPFPAKYFTYQHVSSSRGCAWKCAFCGSPQFWGKGIRFRSPGHFVEELEMLFHKGVTFFYVSDDAFTIDKGRVIEICRRIIEKKLGITWYAISRVNCVDEEMLVWMRKAGCIQISYGIESGSEKIRKRLNKQINRDQIKRAFALTTRCGILSRAYFIYGSPGETWETVQETIDLAMEIKPLSAIFYILDIFPGTKLYADLKKHSGMTDDIWLKKMEGIMHFETDPNLSDDLILAFGKKLRTSFYENVDSFARNVSLVRRKDLYEGHAEFCSRLGMTFFYGDYATIDLIRNKEKTAEELFTKSLRYFPDHRAYLGLGLIRQKRGEIKESVQILQEGLKHWPDSEELCTCLGVNFMNLREFDKALSLFSKFPESKTAGNYAAACRRALRDSTILLTS
jgi:anaerobic magnesium-protoporphyrin IX monomethyl ester cyclase